MNIHGVKIVVNHFHRHPSERESLTIRIALFVGLTVVKMHWAEIFEGKLSLN
jgi:hypothetical protein